MELKIILFRLIFTFILAFLFGIERQKSHKPVGFGTFIFVSIGACSLSLIAIQIDPLNPFPLLSAIVTGIGFLGAGALIKTSDKTFGFTTASSIWLFSIVGVIIGLGYYAIGLLVYALIWIAIIVDRYLENAKFLLYQKRIGIKIGHLDKEESLTRIFVKYKIKKYKLISKKIDKKEKTIFVKYLIEANGVNLRKMLEELENIPHFIEFYLE